MIKYAIEYLKTKDFKINDKIIISGYSEGAKFASHFALLHPEIIKVVIAGGTGGCISMPIKELDGYKYEFPIGISDVNDFDMNSFKDIRFFYYMGDEDKCDSARPFFENKHYIDENGVEKVLCDECGNPMPPLDEEGNPIYILDDNGNYTAKYNNCFNDEEVNIINKTLGTVTQERFKKQKEIYEKFDLDCEFKMYKGNHVNIFNNKELFDDVDKFILNKSNNQSMENTK